MYTMFSSSKSIRRDIINYFIKFLAGKSINGNVLLPHVKQNGRIAKKCRLKWKHQTSLEYCLTLNFDLKKNVKFWLQQLSFNPG